MDWTFFFFFFFLPWQPHYGDFRARELYIYLDQHEEVWASLSEEGGWIAYGTHRTRDGTSLPRATGSLYYLHELQVSFWKYWVANCSLCPKGIKSRQTASEKPCIFKGRYPPGTIINAGGIFLKFFFFLRNLERIQYHQRALTQSLAEDRER